MALPFELTDEENKAAVKEGWTLNRVYGCSDERDWHIERIDETAIFDSDEEAWEFVYNSKSRHALKAMEFLRFNEPGEYIDIIHHCLNEQKEAL